MQRRMDIVFGAFFTAVLAAAAVLTSHGSEVTLPGGARLGTLCLMRWAGHDCPFCGMTRSFVALLHGEVGNAFALHPAGPLLALILAGSVIAMIVLAWRRARPLTARRGYGRLMEAVAVICCVAGVARWFW